MDSVILVLSFSLEKFEFGDELLHYNSVWYFRIKAKFYFDDGPDLHSP